MHFIHTFATFLLKNLDFQNFGNHLSISSGTTYLNCIWVLRQAFGCFFGLLQRRLSWRIWRFFPTSSGRIQWAGLNVQQRNYSLTYPFIPPPNSNIIMVKGICIWEYFVPNLNTNAWILWKCCSDLKSLALFLGVHVYLYVPTLNLSYDGGGLIVPQFFYLLFY